MLGNQARAGTATMLLAPIAAAATANATGGWVDVRHIQGEMAIICQVGAITGTLTPTIRTASTSGGAGDALLTTDADMTAFSATGIQKITVSRNSTLGYIKFVGTIVTGPALVSACVVAHPGQM